jgi:protocatechuate 3,4-dioxygenase beta subunit
MLMARAAPVAALTWSMKMELDNDDRMIGRILTRREVLALLGAAGAGVLAGCAAPTSGGQATSAAGEAATATTAPSATAAPTAAATAPMAQPTRSVSATSAPTAAAAVATTAPTVAVTAAAAAVPACVVRPEVTEGPYYLDLNLLRSDVRADSATGAVREGAPLMLTFNVSQVSDGACTPLEGATVDIWHCDAAGAYSGVGGAASQDWLRGSQMTDASGVATFTTVYPGWYPGRAVHIHFKVHPSERTVFTSQLFFDDAFTAQVYAQEPYAARGAPDRPNSADGIYESALQMVTTATDGGYAASFDIAVDLS